MGSDPDFGENFQSCRTEELDSTISIQANDEHHPKTQHYYGANELIEAIHFTLPYHQKQTQVIKPGLSKTFFLQQKKKVYYIKQSTNTICELKV